MSALTAGAVAAPNPGPAGDGPQSANIPYVAWVGEHVRIVACDPVINSDLQYANYAVEDWSGYQFQPPTPDGDAGNNLGQIFDPGPSAFFQSSEPAHEIGDGGHEGCVATDYKSLNPGLSRIRLVVREQGSDEIVYSHQFLVIWLTANKPTLSEASLSGSGTETFQSQLSGEGQGNLSHFLGDPSGDGSFVPSPFSPEGATNEDKGLIQIKVTGSFPVVKESPLSNILESSSYTLPEAWEELAKNLASSSEETEAPGTNPGLWDIHGSPGNGNGNDNASSTEGPLKADFYRPAFSDYTSGATATIGPFDPQAAEETLLSNGEVNADDAPMPALRVDVRIAPNTPGGINGVGQISGASKAQIYSRNFNGDAEEADNLYNPYYGEYIPATNRPVNEASGIDGSSPGGDFPGFLNKHPEPYTFWNSVLSSEPRSAHATGCLRRAPGKSTDATEEDDYFTPGGDLRETFYTDERGEAYVTYTPGDGFYFENLGVSSDTNNGCDLESLYEKEIGNSSITATGVYPYEPVDYRPVTSEPLVKTVKSLWLKETYEFPKGTSPADQNIRIIVAKAQDIDGYPFVGEEVCFNTTSNSGIASFDGHIVDTEGLLGFGAGTTVYLSGSTVIDPSNEGTNYLCETTNSQGLAAIEVTNSTESEVDVTTHYINEGITRDHMFSFAGNAASVKAEEKAAKTKAENEEKRATEEAAKKKADEEATAKEEAEHKTTAEIEAAKKVREAEEAAEKAKHEKEAAAEAAAAASQQVQTVATTVAAAVTGTTSGTPAASGSTTSGGASGGVSAYTAGSKGHKAHAASKKSKKHKKAKKSKKKK
ncbi:MAG TPA: hypothetical protein VK756_04450 [Solirubrobacteraceae bacterium]|nr:hypothetical protein [Solirubrobacteraceae bacterium]